MDFVDRMMDRPIGIDMKMPNPSKLDDEFDREIVALPFPAVGGYELDRHRQ